MVQGEDLFFTQHEYMLQCSKSQSKMLHCSISKRCHKDEGAPAKKDGALTFHLSEMAHKQVGENKLKDLKPGLISRTTVGLIGQKHIKFRD